MKFLDKIKDLFTDEEEEFETKEIIIDEEKKEEPKLPTFMRNKIAEEEKNNKIVENAKEEETIISDREVIKSPKDSNFAFPVDLEDEYEVVYNTRNKNVLTEREPLNRQNKVADLYTKKEEPKPKKFQPTPVISPVYGVLDKNYTKDEVKVQDENSYEIQRSSRKIDFETVRNKAYGTLTDELRNNLCENCELYKEVKIIKKNGKRVTDDDINLLTDITEEPTTHENISIGEAAENYYDFGVDYEPPKKVVPPVKEEEPSEDIDDIKIVNHNEEESSAEKIEVKEEIEIPEMEEEIKEPPKRKRKTTVKKEEEKELEDTKEFEKIVEPEDNIETILESAEKEESVEDIIMDTDSNDIFNLIDSMYDEEEK